MGFLSFKCVCVWFAAYFVVLLASVGVKAQTFPVGLFDSIEDSIRRSQLLGRDSVGLSYMIRPVRLYQREKAVKGIQVLPLVLQTQYNTHHPYGMNDGAMVPAKGLQVMMSGGVYGEWGPLSIQARPEFIYAANPKFNELRDIDNGGRFSDVYAVRFGNRIDMPERFGRGNYTRASLGQSSVRLTFDPVSFGLSNENLWWGPGVRSSLLMSNNAPGFKHLTLNTTRPVDVFVGKLEAQIVGGRLESSGVERLQDSRFEPKRRDWRYFSGIVMTYQPKWIPGLYVGFDRSFVMYNEDIQSIGEYFPLFTSVAKSRFNNPENTVNSEDQTNRDQYISFFARWVMPSSRSEVYFQFGRNDHSWDLRDAFVEPEHSSAYVVGFKKLLPLTVTDSHLQLGMEYASLAGSSTGSLRAQPSWYAHHQVRHGYTNNGQVIGAGIGPGSKMLTLNLDWVRGIKRVGLQIEHLTQNEDLFNFAFDDTGRKWRDLSVSGKYDFNFNSFIFNSQISYIKSSNYQYVYDNGVGNISFRVGLLYLFR